MVTCAFFVKNHVKLNKKHIFVKKCNKNTENVIFHDFVHFQPFLQVCRVLLMDFMFCLQILLFAPTLHFLRKSMESCEMY